MVYYCYFKYFRHNFLHIRHGTNISPQPNLISGFVGDNKLEPGVFDIVGASLTDAPLKVAGSPLRVKPVKPFAVNSQNWGEYIYLSLIHI